MSLDVYAKGRRFTKEFRKNGIEVQKALLLMRKRSLNQVGEQVESIFLSLATKH